MGAGESKQKLGERVIAARNKLEQDLQMVNERGQSLRNASPATMKLLLNRMKASFESMVPFLARTLLVAWGADSDQCKDFILKASKKVLTAPIKKNEYEWFNQYVLPSTVWMFETKPGRFMFEELMEIVQRQSADIVSNMDSVYVHLEKHSKWAELMAIKNQAVVSRQDDAVVGLLRDAGFRSISDEKDEEIRGFVDSHVAIQALTVTAKAVDREFQQYMGTVMGSHGVFGGGPTKKVERCLSKLENDYYEAEYPKSAKLLDLVRCSVTFNTLEQLLVGYRELMSHMDRSSSNIKMARVKNGFLDKAYDGGYRDIKVNVVFQSPINPELKMICEVQLLLSQYLNEKKKIHKLYSIAREEAYFQMTVKKDEASGPQKELKDLKFKDELNVGKEIVLGYKGRKDLYKCSVDSDSQLLAVEGWAWFGVVDLKQKKQIFELKKKECGFQASHFITIQNQKYLSVQNDFHAISMFKVLPDQDSYKLVPDDKYKIEITGDIYYVDFDKEFKYIVLVTNGSQLELRSMNDVKKIQKSIKLDETVTKMAVRSMQLSDNGQQCLLSGGNGKPYFYWVDIENRQQRKFTSKYLEDTNAVCFINGKTKYAAAGDNKGRVEIWDIEKKEPFKSFQTDKKWPITSSASTHNIFAVGSMDKTLRLYDVRTWECFYTRQFECNGYALHLTQDLKYVTFAGDGDDQCVVLKTE